MQIYKGKTGLNQTWQEPFPETMKCNKCKGECRIMFVACEGYEGKGKFICDLYDNVPDVGYWVHDACAVAVYLCSACFEVNGIINQA